MSLDYISLLKNFQPVIASYQDVSAIYTKLFTQGQLQKLASAITEIYDEEHVFTLTGRKTSYITNLTYHRTPKILPREQPKRG